MRKCVPVVFLLSLALVTSDLEAGWLATQKAKIAAKKELKADKKQTKLAWKAELAGAKAEGGKKAVSLVKLTAQLEQLSNNSNIEQEKLAGIQITDPEIAEHWQAILDRIKTMVGEKRIAQQQNFNAAKTGDPLKDLRFDMRLLNLHYQTVGRSLKRETTVANALNQIIADINTLDAKYQSALDKLTKSAGQRFAGKLKGIFNKGKKGTEANPLEERITFDESEA